MKLSSLPEVTRAALFGATSSRGEIEIVCDPYTPKGVALMFADALVVRSLNDDILEIADYRAMRLRPIETPSSWMAL